MRWILMLALLAVLATPAGAATRHHTDPPSGCSAPSDTGNPACGTGTRQQNAEGVVATYASCADMLAFGLSLADLRAAGLPC